MLTDWQPSKAGFTPVMSNSLYRPEIDGLRALSVISVVLFHADFGVPGGYIGVDVFFVISGFLITRLILKDLEAGEFSIASFWERRIRRIFPALAVMLGAVLVAGYFLLLPTQLADLGESSLAQSLLLANIYFWRDTGYFTAPAEQKPLLHTWSLAVEEQFYLVFPIFLLAIQTLARRSMRTVIAMTALLSFATAVYGVYNHPVASFFLLPTRAWELLAGSLLAFIPNTLQLPKSVYESIASLGVIAILFAAFQFDDHTPFPGLAALLPVGGAAAFIFANSCRISVVGRLLSVTPLVFVGQISYSLYLWHWPILVFLRCALGSLRSWPLTLSAVFVSFFVAVLSWRFVELPFRRRSTTATKCVVFACTVSVQAVLIGVAGLFWTTNGVPTRLVELQRVVSDSKSLDRRYGSYIHELETGQLPVIGRNNKNESRVDFALFGDSHAMALAPVFDLVSKRHSLRGFVIATDGISPFRLTDEISKRNELFLELLSRERIKTVVVVVRWDYVLGKSGTLRALVAMLESMERVGVERVFLFRQVPCQPLGDAYRQQIVASFRFPGLVNLPRTSVKEYQDQLKVENRFFDKLPSFKSLDVDVVDTSTHSFDNTGYCRVLESGRALYYDDDHLSSFGAEVLLDETVESVLSGVVLKRESL